MSQELGEGSTHPTTAYSSELPSATDVLVIGGGIAGTSAAYHIASAGLDVTLVEAAAIGAGTTAAAVGVLSPPLRQPFHQTAHDLGDSLARLIWRFGLCSVAGLGELLTERGESEGAELDLRGGHVLAQPHTQHLVESAFAALEAAGMPVEWLPGARIREEFGGHGFSGGYRIEGGGSLSPGPVTRSLARAAMADGAKVVERARVTSRVWSQEGCACETTRGPIFAGSVVHATHVEASALLPSLRGKIVPVRGQGFSTAPLDHSFPGSFTSHWKLDAWRQAPDGRLLVAGWRHAAGGRLFDRSYPAVDDELQAELSEWFDVAFPRLGPLEVEERWSGVFGWTADYLPLVGRVPGTDRDLVIAGFSGGGLPFAFGCGELIAKELTGTARPTEFGALLARALPLTARSPRDFDGIPTLPCGAPIDGRQSSATSHEAARQPISVVPDPKWSLS